MTYSEKLKDPRWQKRRLKIMEYAHWKCQICGVADRTLHCHHSYYTRGKEPWQYPDGAIICICDACHEKIHPKKAAPVASTFSTTPLTAEPPDLPGPDHFKKIFADLRAKLEEMPDR